MPLGWKQSALVLLLAAAFGAGPSFDGAQAETATAWHQGHNSRVRMVTGSTAGKVYAGIEIELAPGWKTYWRNPGDAGGVPPTFSWKDSTNLLSSVVLYPAPKRLKDAAGDTIGYSGHVVFPARVAAVDPAKPQMLAVDLEYGICKEICIPVEVRLMLELPPHLEAGLPAALAAALDKVPRLADVRRPGDPSLVRRQAHLDGAKPHLLLEADFPGGARGADAFIEGPDGVYVPQPQLDPAAPSAGSRRTFLVDLSSGVDLADLRGKRLTVTLTSEEGQSQVVWPLD